ncbi:acyl-CoA thioesterase [Streptomyces fuscigenes]|uniref:acyl-CoA thioesterase n=1 Tax=Streptomyces fuscigenes TaxID=1528880 RepID=UPI001F183E67|nr:thioesterase family protein [Streptomyces fuscigenes]MCF3964799.1 acyl-CoA thioesterase [Streptomyces fuscigenes]
MTGAAPTPPGSGGPSVPYGVLLPVSVHFDELDAFGMLHNARYAVLVERAWAAFWYAQGVGVTDGAQQAGNAQGDAFNVIKAFTITFEAPITTTGPYAVHLWMERLGATSATAGYRVCSPDGARTHAHGTRTVVRLDRDTLRPARWSDRVRELSDLIAGPART